MHMPRTVDYSGNGSRATPTFSAAELDRRQAAARAAMAELDLEVALFTSYQNICWLSDFLYCRFGRRYGLIVGPDTVTSVSAGIDGGQPWRRTRGGERHLHRLAARQLLRGAEAARARRADASASSSITSTSRLRALLRAPLPGGAELVDVSGEVMRLRTVKSAEEIEHIAAMAEVADIGGAAVVEAVRVGVPEHEVALASTARDGARDREPLAARGAPGHLDLVPVRDQHRRRAQPGHLAARSSAATC